MDRNRELWAAANMLIKRYGADALHHAASRADALQRQGDVRGHATFVAIIERIEKLTAPVRGGLN